jgi:hypothetical protein
MMTKQEVIELCTKTATTLDALKDGEKLPVEVGATGKTLMQANPEFVWEAVRGQIGLERIVKHNVDEEPSWSDLLHKVAEWCHSSGKYAEVVQGGVKK